MGSRSRMGPEGRKVENAQAARLRMRQEASIAREELAIKLYAQGVTVVEIENAMQREFGVKMQRQILALVRRGLYRRAVANEENVAAAKEMFLAKYQALFEVYMPLALGRPGADGGAVAPDLRAAELVLKVMDKAAVMSGALIPPRSTDINLTVINQPPDEAEAIRARVTEQIERERGKQHVIDGELGQADPSSGVDNRVMPPFPLGPAPS